MIEVKDLTKYFGPILAVDRATFHVDRGEICGFLGLNGAGKTTTMRILTTYLPATSGTARVANFDVFDNPLEIRRNIGYLPENVPLYPEMRVDEYLRYRGKLKGVTRLALRQRVEYCIERCRLLGVRRRLIGTLSKGFRQRVGLADAMIHNPPLLILDEPTAGLDPEQIRETLNLIKEFRHHHTVLLSTHILSEVESTCSQVVIISRGRVGASKQMSEIESERSIFLEAKGEMTKVRSLVHNLPGVVAIRNQRMEGEFAALEISTEGDADLREALGTVMAREGCAIRRLDQKHRRLEDAFFSIVRAPVPSEAPSTAITQASSPNKSNEQSITNLPSRQ